MELSKWNGIKQMETMCLMLLIPFHLFRSIHYHMPVKVPPTSCAWYSPDFKEPISRGSKATPKHL
jgi:hypothetical protein